jgi:O-antigen/teichoic acid export membrane protein
MGSTLDFLREIYTAFKSSNSLKGAVVRGAAGTFVLKIANKLLAFITTLILAKTLGVSGYGAYSYILSIVALLSIPSVMGMDRLLIRDVARYRTEGQWGLIRGLIRWTNSMVMVISITILLLAWSITALFFKGNSNLNLSAFWIALMLIPLNGLIRLRQTALQGLQKVIAGQMPELLIQPALLIIFLLAVFVFMKYPAVVHTSILLNVISSSLVFFAGIYLLKKNLPPEIKNAAVHYRKSEWLRTIMPFFAIAVVQIINQRANIVMLGSIEGPHAAGIYAVAERLADLITFILVATNTAIAPVIASLYASNEKQRLQRMVKKIVRVLFLTALPVVITFIVFGKWILLLFGRGFTDGYPVLVILSAGQFVNVSMGPVGLLLTMTGNEAHALRGLALSAGLNVILNLLLIPSLGAMGSALAGAMSLITWNVVLAVMVYKRIGIRVW